MFAAVAKSIFGSANDRYVRSLGKYVDAINGFEPNISALSDDELARTAFHTGAGRDFTVDQYAYLDYRHVTGHLATIRQALDLPAS